MKRPALPLEIILEITGRCRLRCTYCTGPRIPDVPLKDITDTLDEMQALGIKAVRITGGEPLIHPEIKTILTYAKSKGFSIVLNTTAENITIPLMKTIMETVAVALVSLQGWNASSNEIYTKSKTSFHEKIKNLFLLKSYVPTLWLATVIRPEIKDNFEQFIPLIQKINPQAWTLLRPIDDHNPQIHDMDINFWQEMTLKIMQARQKSINAFIANPIPLCITGNLDIGKKAFFGANFDDGHVRIVRSAQGYYKPNYFMDINLGPTIHEAWQHPFLRDIEHSDYLPTLCQECPVLDTCRGGCRSMALYDKKTAFAADPLFDVTLAQKALLRDQKKCTKALSK